MTWPPADRVPYPGDQAGRIELADAILRARHRCLECSEPLAAPVWDEGRWIPHSVHLPWCPVLRAGPAMILCWLDLWDALHFVGFAADYGQDVPAFSQVAA